jgi:hypothetical protein
VTASVAYLRSPRAVHRVVGDEVLIALPGNDSIESLSATAGVVWDLLREPRSADELVEILQAEFAGPNAEIAHDVTSLLADLSARGLVEEKRAAGHA